MLHGESSITETRFARLPFNYGWVIAAVGALGIFTFTTPVLDELDCDKIFTTSILKVNQGSFSHLCNFVV